MSIHIDWDATHPNIILTTYNSGWTWDEFYDTAQKATEMMNTVEHQVFIIADMRNKMVPSGAAFTHAKSAMSNYPDNWAGLIIVSDRGLVQTMVSVFLRIFRTDFTQKTHQVQTLEAAYELAKEKTEKQHQ